MCPVHLEGAQCSAPYQQGDLDGLCGLYAIVNALHVIRTPGRGMAKREAQGLFVAGLTYLNRRTNLHRYGGDGMPPAMLHRLAVHLAARANQVTGGNVSIKRPVPRPWKRAALLSTIDNALHRGAPVIIAFEKAHDHYSVIVGSTANRYRLFDSSMLQWIARDSLGISKSKRRHQVSAGGLLIVVPGIL